MQSDVAGANTDSSDSRSGGIDLDSGQPVDIDTNRENTPLDTGASEEDARDSQSDPARDKRSETFAADAEDEVVSNTDNPLEPADQLEPAPEETRPRDLVMPAWADGRSGSGSLLGGFNRLLVSLLFAGLATASVFALLIMFDVVIPDEAVLGVSLTSWILQLTTLSGWILASATLLCVSVFILSLAVLRYEVFPGGSHRPVLVRDSELGRVTIDVASIAMLVERTVSTIPSVRTIHARVRIGDLGLLFDCDIVAEPHAVLTDLGPEIQDMARNRVEQQIGLRVEEVMTRIRYLSFKHDRRAL